MAAIVIAVALAIYAVAATFDRWPALVVAAWGAALGAGMAINGIALRELDFGDRAPVAFGADRMGAVQFQLCAVLIAIAAWQTAASENLGWAAATVGLAIAGVWSLSRLTATLEHASWQDGLRAYFRAFQVLALLLAIGLMYASVALESEWLWRPAVPADVQAFVWLAVLEFAGLPLTLLAVTRERDRA